MTRDDAEAAMSCLGRAIDALGKTPPDEAAACREVTEALTILTDVPGVHADKALRPGLNFHERETE